MVSGGRGIVVGCAALAAALAFGCRKSDLVGVSGDVYVERSVPGLHRAAEKISNARKGETAPAQGPRTFSVSVREGAGLGPESFRFVVEPQAVRVEGGGPGGALYGALAMARWIRQGREPEDVPEIRPRFAFRAVRVGGEPPWTADAATRRAWAEFLDRLASARWNALLVPVGDRLPDLVVLERYPRAFDGLGGKPREGCAAFQEFLRAARELNVQVILRFESLAMPKPFVQRYATSRGEADLNSALGRSYVAECVASLLKTYPELAGVGVGGEALEDVHPEERADFARATFGNGIRSAGRRAILFLEESAAAALEGVSFPAEVSVVAEVRHGSALAAALSSRRSGAANASTWKLCAALPVRVASPVLPGLENALGAILEIERSLAPEGILIELSSPAGLRPHFDARNRLFGTFYGLSAFDPPIDASTGAFFWREVLGEGGDELSQTAEKLARAWSRLADFHAPERGWDVLTATESSDDPTGLRDERPFVSLVEFVFSPARPSSALSIPEFVAREVEGKPADPSLADPPSVAKALVDAAAEALAALRGRGLRGGSKAGDAEAVAAAAEELRAAAHLVEYHGRRIRAGVAFLRCASGRDRNARPDALEEMRKALASWKEAEESFAALRERAGSSGAFPPDLAAFRPDAERDLTVLETFREDPDGFRSYVASRNAARGTDPDFREIQGLLDFGIELLRATAVACDPAGQHFELEDFPAGWKLGRDLYGYSGAGYLSSGAERAVAGVAVAIRLHAERAASCQFWLRAYVARAGGSSAVLLRLNGRDLGTTHRGPADVAQFTWERVGSGDLVAGTNVLEVVDAGTGREYVDALVITEDPKWVPPTF